jgi:hypothetical protein
MACHHLYSELKSRHLALDLEIRKLGEVGKATDMLEKMTLHHHPHQNLFLNWVVGQPLEPLLLKRPLLQAFECLGMY